VRDGSADHDAKIVPFWYRWREQPFRWAIRW